MRSALVSLGFDPACAASGNAKLHEDRSPDVVSAIFPGPTLHECSLKWFVETANDVRGKGQQIRAGRGKNIRVKVVDMGS
jgi:hypothetical protein